MLHEDISNYKIGERVEVEMRELRAGNLHHTPPPLIAIALRIEGGVLNHDNIERVNFYDGKNKAN